MNDHQVVNIMENIEYLPSKEVKEHSLFGSIKFPLSELTTLGIGVSSLPEDSDFFTG